MHSRRTIGAALHVLPDRAAFQRNRWNGHVRAMAFGEAGVHAINFDLMYGLPHQTREDLHNTITQPHSLRPSRIALFGYAHVPWFKTHQCLIDAAALPGA